MDVKRLLKALSKEYPTIQSAVSQIVYLNGLLKLPKGTEYFFSDLHGEYEGFLRLLNSASGIVQDKINEVFQATLTEAEKNQLANLIYAPEQFLSVVEIYKSSLYEWKQKIIYQLIRLNRHVASKYTREYVQKCLPKAYAHPINELIHEDATDPDKAAYYEGLIQAILSTGSADDFISALCHLVLELLIAKLHIIGDIFDRGPRADIIMDELMNARDVDIQWGNHDISWMGAACGNQACIANVVRIALSYNNFDVLEDGYGINLRSLSLFASEVYGEDTCASFRIHKLDENRYDVVDSMLAARMLKAITIIQLKLEGQLLNRHPEYDMEDRKVLEKIDFSSGTIRLYGKSYPLNDTFFPTVDPDDPLTLTEQERQLMRALTASFQHSKTLHRHIRFLYSNGEMYTRRNGNLLFHGCIPMKEDGSFAVVEIDNKPYSGKAYLDILNKKVEQAYFLPEEDPDKQSAVDLMWYLWCGKLSPVFGKSKMATFENYFIQDPEAKKEIYNPYYSLSKKEEICMKILKEFEMDPEHGHIINGHVPVKLKKGESPIRGNGKLFVIDGGLSKAYQTRTGIAGYTLIFNSRCLALAEHKSYFDAQANPSPITPSVHIVEQMKKRVLVEDTDDGEDIREQINELRMLVQAYQDGWLKQAAQ